MWRKKHAHLFPGSFMSSAANMFFLLQDIFMYVSGSKCILFHTSILEDMVGRVQCCTARTQLRQQRLQPALAVSMHMSRFALKFSI